MRSGSPSGATRSSTCQMPMTSHGRSAAASAPSSRGAGRAAGDGERGAATVARRRRPGGWRSRGRRARRDRRRPATDGRCHGPIMPHHAARVHVDRVRSAPARGTAVGHDDDRVDERRRQLARTWRDPLGRAGIAARGVLYIVLGILAIQFARGETSSDAGQPDRRLRDRRPSSRSASSCSSLLTLGLLAMRVWRLIQAFVGDPVEGDEAKDRAKYFGKAVIYGVADRSPRSRSRSTLGRPAGIRRAAAERRRPAAAAGDVDAVRPAGRAAARRRRRARADRRWPCTRCTTTSCRRRS